MSTKTSENIKAKIKQNFSGSEQQEIVKEFEKLGEYFDESEDKDFFASNEVEKIYLGILKLSNGKLPDFYDAISEAKNDWRNILYWSETSN